MTRAEAMRAVQMYDFAMKDTELFLDTHPNNEAALAFYNDTREKALAAIEEYEEQFGPLTASDTDVNQGWTWVETPWPWEMED
ncbi:spore coat protein CotJB [Ihubacter sp. rT4E-8]|uniref:spore coat protein CotJB n=1 Tax=unclassified Ihubacter TaxID=2633299 RepID=UPI0013797CF2